MPQSRSPMILFTYFTMISGGVMCTAFTFTGESVTVSNFHGVNVTMTFTGLTGTFGLQGISKVSIGTTKKINVK